MVNKEQYSLNMLTDIETVGHAIDGDEKAFSLLLEKYQDSIYYLMLKKTGNTKDAEDLTMETFAKAFNNLEQYTPVYAFSTWLYKIAINHSIDFARKKKVRKVSYNSNVDFNDPEGLQISSNTLSPEDQIIKAEKKELIKDLVKKLKPRYAKLIELRYYNELSYEEISQELQLPMGSVKAQLFRAKELLTPLFAERKDQ
ncbi:MAG: sigma-70 family RNA polymerase sigma factor [Bacteroidales bacterium]|jgi:RNA polymerase sigma-70 factor (ECF subfamily)|nr:sigma-70 family RNA polymerase sigma factor [Bacteroidales bacterium]